MKQVRIGGVSTDLFQVSAPDVETYGQAARWHVWNVLSAETIRQFDTESEARAALAKAKD